jgi:RimJ/RimL family protein N-acetyltransferase
MFAPDYPLRTERLTLRPYRESDLEYVADTFTRPEVVRYLYDEVWTPETVADLLSRRQGLGEIRREGDRLVLAVEETATGQVVGDVSLTYVSVVHRSGEVGWIFSPTHQGKGYATEAATEILRIGFEEMLLRRIFARCDARNVASVRVMEKLGMRREAHFVENEFVKGEWTDELVYALLASEWKERR